MGGLLVADVVEHDGDDVDAHAPVVHVGVDQVAGQVLLAVAARPNAHHLVGLEHQVGRKLVGELLFGVDASLQHPVGHGDVLVAARVLEYDHFAVGRALGYGDGALGAALKGRLRAHLGARESKVGRRWRLLLLLLLLLLWLLHDGRYGLRLWRRRRRVDARRRRRRVLASHATNGRRRRLGADDTSGARLLALEQAAIGVYLELERGLVVHELVVVAHELLEASAHLADVAVGLVEREAVVASHVVELLLELTEAHDEVGVVLLELAVLALAVAQRRLQVGARLDLDVDERVDGVALGRLLRDLLRLDLVPLLELALLLLAEVLEVAADVAYGALQLVTVELGRVDVRAGLERAQLGHLLLVDGVEKGYLLLERLLLVLELDASQRLLVEVGQQALQVLAEAGDLLLVLVDVGLGVVHLTPEQVELDAVLLEQVVEAGHLVLVRLDGGDDVVVLTLEVGRLVLAALGAYFGDGLLARRVVDGGARLEQLGLVAIAHGTRLLAPPLTDVLELGEQLLVLALQELDAVDVLGEAVVELVQHLLLVVALLLDRRHRQRLHRLQAVLVAAATAAVVCHAHAALNRRRLDLHLVGHDSRRRRRRVCCCRR